MKKIYHEPQLNIVAYQNRILSTSNVDSVSGNADFVYGGKSSGDIEGRAKQHNDWDDYWE